jgi:glutamyl-tRNA(Gln) amidotransferase subunit E
MQTDKIIGKVERRQRAVVGELGAMDRSTSFESSKGREFCLQCIPECSSCLVDLDEEPPHNVNKEAVESWT